MARRVQQDCDDTNLQKTRSVGAGLEDKDEDAAALSVNETDGEDADAEAEEGDGGRAGSAKGVSPLPPTPKAAHAPAPPLSRSSWRRLSYGEADAKRIRSAQCSCPLSLVAASGRWSQLRGAGTRTTTVTTHEPT